jgi:hypothetical protein
MKIRESLTRQFIELLKLYLISQIIPVLLVANQLAGAENPVDQILQGLNLPFFMAYGLMVLFPHTIVWFLWLSFAHVLAVQVKYNLATTQPRSKIKMILMNRPFILAVGILIFYPAWTLGSYAIAFSVILELNYFMYLLVSKLFRAKG